LADLCMINFNEEAKEIPSVIMSLHFVTQWKWRVISRFIAAPADKIFESTDVKLQSIN
jgi:hypothetical protein